MTELQWKDAIEKVLQEEKKAMNYTEIAELIALRGYRTSMGATPQQTVIAILSTDTKKGNSIFEKVDKDNFFGNYLGRIIYDLRFTIYDLRFTIYDCNSFLLSVRNSHRICNEIVSIEGIIEFR